MNPQDSNNHPMSYEHLPGTGMAVLLVRVKQPFVDWINQVEKDAANTYIETLENVNSESNHSISKICVNHALKNVI